VIDRNALETSGKITTSDASDRAARIRRAGYLIGSDTLSDVGCDSLRLIGFKAESIFVYQQRAMPKKTTPQTFL